MRTVDGPSAASGIDKWCCVREVGSDVPDNVRESRSGEATPESFFGRVVAEFGAPRIAWGSNYPASEGTLAGILGEARSALAALPSPDRDWIFSRTAQSLYPALAGL